MPGKLAYARGVKATTGPVHASDVRQGERYFALALALVAVVGAIDYLTGRELSVAIFYLPAVAVATWQVGRLPGYVLSFLSASVWFLADVAGGNFQAIPMVTYWNAGVLWGFFFFTVIVLSRLRAAVDHEKSLSRQDQLTGVASRRAFLEAAQLEWERSRRFRRSFTLIMLDCDDFKQVNDRYGHSAGDLVLRAVADTLAATLRAVDLLARFGGDEFVALLPETDEDQARATVPRLRDALARSSALAAHGVTCSLGVTTWRSDAGTLEDALQAADAVMYAAKNAGKNTVVFSSPDDNGP